MMNWTPISRGKPEVIGPDPNQNDRLQVRIPLTPPPPPEWVGFFDNPIGISIPISMNRPQLQGGAIVIRTPDADLEKYILHVDERVSAANRQFESEALPRLRADEAAKKAAEEAAEARKRDAQRRLDNL